MARISNKPKEYTNFPIVNKQITKIKYINIEDLRNLFLVNRLINKK